MSLTIAVVLLETIVGLVEETDMSSFSTMDLLLVAEAVLELSRSADAVSLTTMILLLPAAKVVLGINACCIEAVTV